MHDEDDNLVNIVESTIIEAALDTEPAADPDTPRDAWWWRWFKFFSLIAAPAIVLGLGFLLEDYFEQYGAGTSYDRSVAQRHVEHDTTQAMKFRFWLGACLGGGLGSIYVVKCIVRGTDP